MSIFVRPRPAETRSISYQDVWGTGSMPGSPIGGPDVVSSGLRLIPVYAATSLIADMLATAPCAEFNIAADGSMKRIANQSDFVRNPDPTPTGSRISWTHQCLTSLLLRGNAYGYVTAVGSDGWPSKVIWLDPDAVTVIENQNDWFHTPEYFWRGRKLDNNLLVHIPAYTVAGSVVGLAPLTLFKLQIETGLRAQQFGDDWFKNGANPSGILQNKRRELQPDTSDAAKKRFKAAVANRDVFVTGSDWDYKTLAVPGNESQFLETIKATATQIASIYRVSPEDIGGETGTSLTYKTLTQDAAKLNVRALGPWAARLEEAFSNLRPRPRFIKYDLDFLARGDRATRIATAQAALKAGIDTLDEARTAEFKAPLTPDEIEFWQDNYGKSSAPPAPALPTGDPAMPGADDSTDTGAPDAGA